LQTNSAPCNLPVTLVEAVDANKPVGKVFFATQQGTSKKFADQFVTIALKAGIELTSCDLSTYEPEFLDKEEIAIFILSTYTDGKPPPSGEWFCRWLSEAAVDERVGVLHLQGTRTAVLGLGNSQYGSSFNLVGLQASAQLAALGAALLLPFQAGDEDGEWALEAQFSRWAGRLVEALKKPPGENMKNTKGSQPVEEEYETESEEEEEEEPEFEGSDDGLDMEDIGGAAPPRRTKKAGGKDAEGELVPSGPKKMATPKLIASLTKQGYKVLGSHSGVKLCRWTKSMLRGRGGCYKHTFYGIESHRCMEATPSLACANKCVFCWRHHTNPIGTEWKWEMDPPLQIVEQAIDAHKGMVKQMRGVPGVLESRLTEGMAPRHCALSLVGEPIMYPEINTLVDDLHRRKISTFLVTNAQFPERIDHLHTVTQLYVSVDAATEDTLKAIDRPLFKDFWRRFRDSLSSLRAKQQRTVYRLTLVKGWNVEEVSNYASLVDLGRPDFIEIKGVTYCGDSNSSSLTMKNVPYYEEVKAFSTELCDKLGEEYGLACAHEHSCSVLLAKKSVYLRNGTWHTWIDYDKFQDLVARNVSPILSEDYMAPTPSWAVYGAEEAGFNPNETRVKKIRRHGNAATAVA